MSSQTSCLLDGASDGRMKVQAASYVSRSEGGGGCHYVTTHNFTDRCPANHEASLASQITCSSVKYSERDTQSLMKEKKEEKEKEKEKEKAKEKEKEEEEKEKEEEEEEEKEI
ncbi:hypothetical protein PoB_001913000 [Plakobranchus ocellatus]|uniref:Uncharacterized protein n=1 Tax=Plakobranchus ocellatus TaxID=259542 RepID=A0AAV3ZBV8_9GAST|nr:hypothetical protein PoB_001913000 [Plakobranchus ocellatus]